jgi:hypothetical protein
VAGQITLSLAVIPEPAPNTRSVLNFTGNDTTVLGTEGPITAECGQCGNPLLVNVEMNAIRNIVIRCGACRAYNESNVYQLARDGLRFLVD